MKRRGLMFIFATVVVGGIFAGLTRPAGASPPATTAITFVDSFTRPLPDCTAVGCSFHGPNFTSPLIATGSFSVSGAISDIGTVVSSFVHADGTAHVQRTLSGASGQITASFQARVESFSDGIATFSGRWLIRGGTGAYTNLHGEGDLTMLLDVAGGTATETWTGVTHAD
jgi:hypothetical protein